ncbi:nickel/cobalt transporter [Aestuariivirga sp.]|uniref:nickel/cobalt transporter n=1 Tax=Aestuariivirga sp. TaxID=2650926 RepID=UPI0025C36E02|nr:nickel/cobalt transporter [Aestuariivirga sp.]MCA3555934.1 nickel/cobalt transporter [Aestuariivirga sp.]
MRSTLLTLLALLILLLTTAPRVMAQPTDGAATRQAQPEVTIKRSQLLAPKKNADGTIAVTPFTEDPVMWARDEQQNFYGRMSSTLKAMRGPNAMAAGWMLMLLSFAYGVLHAAGPGHGKAVISTWLLATESELRRGVLICFMSAIIQALTAIVLVSALFLVVASAGSTARDAAGVLESASYALIGLLGLYLIWTALRLLAARRAAAAPAPAFVATRQSIALSDFASFEPVRNEAAGHVHGPGCGCGHTHLPEARDLAGDVSFARAFSLAFAVGIRPCTGAILVLVFANGLGLYWAGIASTFAMALGTFITVSAIAAMAVYGKKIAAGMLRGKSGLPGWAGIGLRLAGGTAIAFLGTILFLGSLGSTNAMM